MYVYIYIYTRIQYSIPRVFYHCVYVNIHTYCIAGYFIPLRTSSCILIHYCICRVFRLGLNINCIAYIYAQTDIDQVDVYTRYEVHTSKRHNRINMYNTSQCYKGDFVGCWFKDTPICSALW